MCGIAALYAYRRAASAEDRARVERMCAHMRVRGPDGAGLWTGAEGRVVLGHRRLAIVDLSERGAQPMHSADGRLTVTFNGEIYNYRALRAELETKGYAFASDSDTEVLLHLYADRGEAMVDALRGMFAFALWDAARGALVLARDPFGIKPLYYAAGPDGFAAASEVGALLAAGGVDTAPDPAGHAGFHLLGYVPEPHTLYRGIRALPAGSLLVVDARGAAAPRAFAEVNDLLAGTAPATGDEPAERVRAALLDSVRHHLVADVDVGVFLSAGLDSATLLALVAEVGGRPRTVTLGFTEYRGTPRDEVPLAEAVARRYGAEHTTVWVTRDDFARERARVLARMDQPTVDGINVYFVARAAAQAGLKVALSGLGGDELFGGYPSFRQVPRLARTVGRISAARVVGRGVRRLAAPVVGRLTSPKYAGLLEYGGDLAGAYLLRRGLFMPWELPALLGPDMARDGLAALGIEARLAASARGPAGDLLAVSALEATWYMRNQLLRDADWASMSHGVEVRVPLVDVALWRAVAPLRRADPTLGKRVMADAARPALTRAVLDRPKTGFTVPVREWMGAHVPGAVGAPGRGDRPWARDVYARSVA